MLEGGARYATAQTKRRDSSPVATKSKEASGGVFQGDAGVGFGVAVLDDYGALEA